MKINFKRAEKKDFEKFLKYFKENFSKNFPYYSKNSINYFLEVDYEENWLKDRLKEGRKKVFIAFNKNNIVGYLLVNKSYAGVAFGIWLAVDNKFRRQGIGSNLINIWGKEAVKEGAHILQLWTTKFYVPFYKKNGFILGGEFPKAWHGKDSYLLYKLLREPKEENYLKDFLKLNKKNENKKFFP